MKSVSGLIIENDTILFTILHKCVFPLPSRQSPLSNFQSLIYDQVLIAKQAFWTDRKARLSGVNKALVN